MKCLDFDWQINEFMVYCRSTQLREKSMQVTNKPFASLSVGVLKNCEFSQWTK